MIGFCYCKLMVLSCRVLYTFMFACVWMRKLTVGALSSLWTESNVNSLYLCVVCVFGCYLLDRDFNLGEKNNNVVLLLIVHCLFSHIVQCTPLLIRQCSPCYSEFSCNLVMGYWYFFFFYLLESRHFFSLNLK